MSIADDIRALKLEWHATRLTYLAVAAGGPAGLEGRVHSVHDLAGLVRAKTGFEALKGSILKSNKLAEFLGMPLCPGTPVNDVGALAHQLLTTGTNSGSSLAMTLLHNAVAAELGMEQFGIFAQDEYYAPFFMEGDCKYSIFLPNTDNGGALRYFKGARVLTNMQGIAQLASINCKHADSVAQSSYLATFAELVLQLKEPKAPAHPGVVYRDWRVRRNFTQEEVGKRVGKGKSTIGDYECGRVMPSAEVDAAIRKFLCIPSDTAEVRVGDEYRIARIKKGLLQQDVAEKIGKARPTLGNYESGDLTPSALVDMKIREVLGIPGAVYHTPQEYAEHRKRKGVSMQAVSALLGFKSRGTYGAYENGDVIPDVYIARKLERILGF